MLRFKVGVKVRKRVRVEERMLGYKSVLGRIA